MSLSVKFTEVKWCTLLAMIALSAVQSLIHNAILFINTSTMLGTTKVIGYWADIFGDNC